MSGRSLSSARAPRPGPPHRGTRGARPWQARPDAELADDRRLPRHVHRGGRRGSPAVGPRRVPRHRRSASSTSSTARSPGRRARRRSSGRSSTRPSTGPARTSSTPGIAVGCAAAGFTFGVVLAALAMARVLGRDLHAGPGRGGRPHGEVGIAPRPERLVVLALGLVLTGFLGGLTAGRDCSRRIDGLAVPVRRAGTSPSSIALGLIVILRDHVRPANRPRQRRPARPEPPAR